MQQAPKRLPGTGRERKPFGRGKSTETGEGKPPRTRTASRERDVVPRVRHDVEKGTPGGDPRGGTHAYGEMQPTSAARRTGKSKDRRKLMTKSTEKSEPTLHGAAESLATTNT